MCVQQLSEPQDCGVIGGWAPAGSSGVRFLFTGLMEASDHGIVKRKHRIAHGRWDGTMRHNVRRPIDIVSRNITLVPCPSGIVRPPGVIFRAPSDIVKLPIHFIAIPATLSTF